MYLPARKAAPRPCRECGEVFSPRYGGLIGEKSIYCSGKCRKKYQARIYRQSPKGKEAAKRWRATAYKKYGGWGYYQMRYEYGISPDEKRELIREQHYICPICKRKWSEDASRWHVDHDHLLPLGGHRGVICPRCNLGLGFFKDSPGILISAAHYILKYRIFRKETPLKVAMGEEIPRMQQALNDFERLMLGVK